MTYVEHLAMFFLSVVNGFFQFRPIDLQENYLEFVSAKKQLSLISV